MNHCEILAGLGEMQKEIWLKKGECTNARVCTYESLGGV